ncbi:beta-ketoacyl synthase chain length factor [Lonepinella sp. MS14435]|uniref:beta-ketoacyl synthase chain length factor n=1 Tax=Lonepinella sp. MS14435 TaxID=3003618 RepID=UPI0036DA6CD7
MQACQFSISIPAWKIVTNKALSEQDWKTPQAEWQALAPEWQESKPALAFLAPLKRRRLSESARLFFESAWQFGQDFANMPVVYASLNSEMNRSFALWQSLLTEGDVSPTSFSLSVHNALIGQWSEMQQVTSECTAISATKDNFETALLEAYLLLNDGHERVLVVIAEMPLNAEYDVAPVERLPFGYSLALVVEKGTQFQLSLQTDEKLKSCDDNALLWVQQQYLGAKTWRSASRKGHWQWLKS